MQLSLTKRRSLTFTHVNIVKYTLTQASESYFRVYYTSFDAHLIRAQTNNTNTSFMQARFVCVFKITFKKEVHKAIARDKKDYKEV